MAHPDRIRSLTPLGLVALVIALHGVEGSTCSPAPPIVLAAPANNAFHALDAAGPLLLVEGALGPGVDLGSAVVTLHLNSVSPSNAVPATIDGSGRFAASFSVDYRLQGSETQKGLNTVFARLRSTSDPALDRRVGAPFVVGEKPGEWGATADTALALRLNRAGLDRLAHALGGPIQQAIDLVTLIGEDGNGGPRQLLDDACVPTSSCLFEIDGFVTLVSHGHLDLTLVPQGPVGLDPGLARATVSVPQLRVHFEAYDVEPPFSNIYCSGRIEADPLAVDVLLDQVPGGQEIVVTQVDATAALANFQLQLDSGPQICNYPTLTSYLQQTMAPQLEALALQQIVAVLEDPDGNGPLRPLIEETAEAAINGLAIGDQLQGALMMDLQGDFTRIEEDAQGISYWVRTTPSVTDTVCESGGLFSGACPDLGESSYLVKRPISAPVASLLAPGGQPYEIGLHLSESFLGQIVKGFAESGGLSGTIDELPSCAAYTPMGQFDLTAGCLFEDDNLLLGATGLAAGDPLEIRYRPVTAPLFPGDVGPLGSHASFSVAGLTLDLRRIPSAGSAEILTRVLLRLNGGLSLVFDEQNDLLSFEIEYCTQVPDPTSNPPITCSPDASATALFTDFPGSFVTPVILDFVVNGTLLPDVILPTLTDGIASLPVPSLLGMGLDEVETTRDQDFLGLFLDLVPPPPCEECQ